MRRTLPYCLGIALLLLTHSTDAQTGQQQRTVVINGYSGQIIVYQINGRSFVDLESLVRIANGSLSFHPDQIVLTIPTSASGNAPPSSMASPPTSTGMTDDFMKAALQTLSVTKSWTDTLAYAAQHGVPGDGSRLVVFHNRAAEALRIAKVDASSTSDQSALQLLTNHVNAVQGWNDTLVAQRRSMDTGQYSMTPNAMQNDPAYQRITTCAKFLDTMLPSGQFHDDGSCR